MNNIKIGLLTVVLAVMCLGLSSCMFPGPVIDIGIAPTARFDVTVNDLTVSFDGRGSYGDGDNIIVSWDWYFGDGTVSASKKPSHTYADYGTYSVLLIVTDKNGDTGRVEREIVITGIILFDPVVVFSFLPSSGIQTDSVVLFNGSKSSVVGDVIERCRWDFGDGTFQLGSWGSTNTVWHTYDAIGGYTVFLTVWTRDGKVKSEWNNVRVR